MKRSNPVDSEHVNGFSIIRKCQRATLARPPPQALLPEGYLPIVEIHSYVCIEGPKATGGRCRRRGGVGRQVVDCADEIQNRLRWCRSGGSALIFSSGVDHEWTGHSPKRCSQRRAKPLLERTAIVIGHGLSKVISIGQGSTRDSH